MGRQDVLVGGALAQEGFHCRDGDAGPGECQLGRVDSSALHDAAGLPVALGGGAAKVGADLFEHDDFGQDDLAG